MSNDTISSDVANVINSEFVKFIKHKHNDCVSNGDDKATLNIPINHNSRYPFFFVIVKYLREVTPYFRKASIIQEVGWELQRGFLSATPPPPKSPPRADTRYLPLQLCRLTRAHPSSDPEDDSYLNRTSLMSSVMR
ncbi:hypothetical protein HZH68_012602 [Vespula germanica]|uniref:Uncharacterized protein n=1 Tax=Vespula germanica TaxID=30212 RepID=A0A834JIG3_VESGE|nr:hypothetical protein HZH68_012602 [Vespula germanica]